MFVVAAKPFVLCTSFSLRNPCWAAAGMGAGSLEHARCCQGNGKVPPEEQECRDDWYGQGSAGFSGALGYWAEDSRLQRKPPKLQAIK